MKTTEKSLLALAFIALLAGCGSGGDTTSNQGDPYVAALQTSFDTAPVWGARSGTDCVDASRRTYVQQQLAPYKRLGVLSGPKIRPTRFWGPEACWTITWPASVTILKNISNNPVVIGKFVVDKVGPEQSGAMDLKYHAYDAHFVANAWGAKIIAAGLATPAPAITDAQATFHVNADGKIVADH